MRRFAAIGVPWRCGRTRALARVSPQGYGNGRSHLGTSDAQAHRETRDNMRLARSGFGLRRRTDSGNSRAPAGSPRSRRMAASSTSARTRHGSGRLGKELCRILGALVVVAEELLAADAHLLAELARAFALVQHDPDGAGGGEDPEQQEPARPRRALRLHDHPGQRALYRPEGLGIGGRRQPLGSDRRHRLDNDRHQRRGRWHCSGRLRFRFRPRLPAGLFPLGDGVEYRLATPALDAEPGTLSRDTVLHGEHGAATAAFDQHGQLWAVSVLSSPKAVCKARTASSAYFSSIRQEILISEVLITRMFTPSSASTWNIFAATPAWLRMPTPTMLTFAIPSSCSTLPAPICLPIRRTSSAVFSTSSRPTVNAMSVRPSSLAGVCTIKTTTTPCSASEPKTLAAIPGLSGTPRITKRDSSRVSAMPLTSTSSIAASSSHTRVPGSPVNDDFTQSGTLYFIANSTLRICSTLEPREASSSISSYEMRSSLRARSQTRGSVV